MLDDGHWICDVHLFSLDIKPDSEGVLNLLVALILKFDVEVS